MNTVSFIYNFVTAPGEDTRDPVVIDIDFSTVFAANPNSAIILVSVLMSGNRQNVAGGVEITESFAARLIGDFNSNGTVTANIAVPRPGDSISLFQGIAFSNSSPFYTEGNFSDIEIPSTFQLEIVPSNRQGNVPNDTLTFSFSIVYRIGSPS